MVRSKFLGIPVDNLTRVEAIKKLDYFIKNSNDCNAVFSLNAYKTYLIKSGILEKNIFDDASIILPDGISIIYGSKLFGLKLHELVAGVDLMIDLIKLADKNEYSVYFLGSPNSLLRRVITKCKKDYLNINIVGFQHGYYNIEDEEKIISKINSVKPDILFVAFGSPRKEEFIHKYKNVFNAKVALAVGGSYEVFVGDKKRGSRLQQQLGLEWFMRFAQDPKRLWKRYLITNILFFYYILKYFIKRS